MSTENWVILEDLLVVLKPLEVATTVFIGEKHITLSVELPIVHGIISQLTPNTSDSTTIRNFKIKVTTGLTKRWGLDGEVLERNRLSVIATAVDPRFKLLKSLTESDVEAVKQELLRISTFLESCIEVQQVDQATSPPQQKKSKSALDILLGEEEVSSTDSEDCIDAEITQFYSEKCVSRDTDPVEWWRENQKRFPLISKVAKYTLCIPATSTASERLFSTAGLTVSKLRSCLKPENVDALTFLHANYRYLKTLDRDRL